MMMTTRKSQNIPPTLPPHTLFPSCPFLAVRDAMQFSSHFCRISKKNDEQKNKNKNRGKNEENE